jgi:hypothetical protein
VQHTDGGSGFRRQHRAGWRVPNSHGDADTERGVTTWCSAGNDGGLFRARGVGCRALPRRSALSAPPTPGGCPRFPEYVVARRYAVSGTALSRSVRVARPTVPPIVLPFKITVKGAPAARPCSARQTLEQLSCPANPLAPIRLDGAVRLRLKGADAWLHLCTQVC